MNRISRRLNRAALALIPIEPPKIDVRRYVVRGGHDAPVERTVKSWPIGVLPSEREIESSSTKWKALKPAELHRRAQS